MKIQVSALRATELATARMVELKAQANNKPAEAEELHTLYQQAAHVLKSASLATHDGQLVTLEDADLRVLVP